MIHSTQPSLFHLTLMCSNLCAAYGGVPLYEDVSFSLSEGAVVAVSAPNGAGKTTLLRHIAGLLAHGTGEIAWFDHPIKTMQDYQQDAIYLSDKNGLSLDLTVMQQLRFFADGWGERTRIDASVHYLGLEPFLEMRISTLSAGWKRRVALSRLLIIPALLWILDEPMVHLDKDGVNLLGGMIHAHAERGGVAIIAMPEMDQTYQLYNIPVVKLDITDFAPNFV